VTAVSHEFINTVEPWIKERPQNWRRFRIKDIAQVSPGFSDTPPAPTEQCAVIPMEAISDKGDIDTTLVKESQDIQQGLTNFEKGDVLFAKITPCMENGKGAFIEAMPTRYGFGSTEFHVLRPGQRIDGKFLYYFAFNSVYRDYAAENMTGAAGQKRVSTKFLAYTSIFLPAINEQRWIAAYLDKASAAIDGAIRAKRRQLEVLDDLRKSIIHKAVTRGLDESVGFIESSSNTIGFMPRHWRQTKFRYEVSVRNGDFASDKLDDEGHYPVIGGNGLMGKTSDFNVDGEVVVVGRVGANCGNAHYIRGQVWVSDNAMIIESRHDKRFLAYLFFALDLNSLAKKTAQPLITGTQIKNIYVALPSLAEQRQIADFIEAKSGQIDILKTNLQGQISALEQYRKSLIHESVTGKRRIAEADLATG
jgi:type I restriction enzyme S subunit